MSTDDQNKSLTDNVSNVEKAQSNITELPGEIKDPIPDSSGEPIDWDDAKRYIGRYRAIQKDVKKGVEILLEHPEINPILIGNLFGSDWNGFAFDKQLVLDLLEGDAPGKCLLVVLGADDRSGFPTIILADCQSPDHVNFRITPGKDPVEHPPKVVVAATDEETKEVFFSLK